MPPKPRLLLTGASGFLGHNIIQQALHHYQVIGIAQQHPINLSGVQVVKFNITDHIALRNMVREVQPDAIIHTAAIGDINRCEQNPSETEVLNVNTSIYLAKLAAEMQIPYVFTSTDLVFNGEKGWYNETDAVNPINHYGEQKVKAEEGIRVAYPQSAICRMPLMFGVGGLGSKNFFLPLLAKLRSKEEIGLFTDEYRSALGAISAAKGLLHAVSAFQGTYHLGGPEKTNRYTLGKLMAHEANIPEPNIKAIMQAEIPMAAPRPKDVTLDSSKAAAAGFVPMHNQKEIGIILGGGI
jgi:dTDP-4-dehydrorhamnose reductase